MSRASTPAVHILAFEGPDRYSRAGGIASRIVGLADALSQLAPTTLWFVGDPNLPAVERTGALTLRRWCDWLCAAHPRGVYDGEHAKVDDYGRSLPPALLEELAPGLAAGGRALVLAEEWHTVPAVLELDRLLRERGLRDRVSLRWTANNVFGFDRINWPALERAATIHTVSRHMRQRMRPLGVSARLFHNGIGAEALTAPDAALVAQLTEATRGRLLLAKVARFDPDKGWLGAIDAVAKLRERGLNPLLVGRGGMEAHGADVRARIAQHGLRLWDGPGIHDGASLHAALRAAGEFDVLLDGHAMSHAARQALFGASAAVLANSSFEPFGLVGLEVMAAGGVAVVGATGEDYVTPGHDALVAHDGEGDELAALLAPLHRDPARTAALRAEGPRTVARWTWERVVARTVVPWLDELSE